MKKKQSAVLNRAKFYSDPVLVITVILLFALLIIFVLYPLVVLLVDSFIVDEN